MSEPVLVVGVGPGGRACLPQPIRERVLLAGQIYGAARLLAEWPDHGGERIPLGANIAGLATALLARGDKRIAVLASGDPGFYGVASTLLERLPADQLEIVPNVSSLQVPAPAPGWPGILLSSSVHTLARWAISSAGHDARRTWAY